MGAARKGHTPGVLSKRELIPETDEDSLFLEGISDGFDFEAAIDRIRLACRDVADIGGALGGGFLVAIIKKELGLGDLCGNIGATRVILNAVTETEMELGAVSLEAVIGKLMERREQVKEKLLVASRLPEEDEPSQ